MDNILVSIIACPSEEGIARSVSGLVLTGGFEPPVSIQMLLRASGVPVILCPEDTYSIAARLRTLRFKIRPQDLDKIEAAKTMVRESIDVSALLAALADKK